MHVHVETWLNRKLNESGLKHVFVTDVTSGYAQVLFYFEFYLFSKISHIYYDNEMTFE